MENHLTYDGGTLDMLAHFIPLTFNYSIAFPYLCALSIILTLTLTRHPLWIGFEHNFRLFSRLVLSLLLLTITFTAQGTAGWIFFGIPGRFTMETPSAASTAIKQSVYSEAYAVAVKSRLTEAEAQLASCAIAISREEARLAQHDCRDIDKCGAAVPVTARPALIEKIKAAKTSNHPACAAVDPALL